MEFVQIVRGSAEHWMKREVGEDQRAGRRFAQSYHFPHWFFFKEKTFIVVCGNYVHIFDPVQLVASDITIFAQIEKCKYWDYNNFCCNYIKLIIHIHVIYRKPINMTHFVKTTNSTKKTKSFGSSKFQINLSPLLVLNVVWIFAAINVSAFCMQSLFFMVTLTVLKTWLSFRF